MINEYILYCEHCGKLTPHAIMLMSYEDEPAYLRHSCRQCGDPSGQWDAGKNKTASPDTPRHSRQPDSSTH